MIIQIIILSSLMTLLAVAIGYLINKQCYISLVVAIVFEILVLTQIVTVSLAYKSEPETIKDYMNGKYRVEIKGTYQDSLFVPSDTIITLK